MAAIRAFLLESLQRVADGGDIDDTELSVGVPDPLALSRPERHAWEELSHWADDGDIRTRDAQYASYKRERMRHWIAVLMNNSD